jgi:hypothetical protein
LVSMQEAVSSMGREHVSVEFLRVAVVWLMALLLTCAGLSAQASIPEPDAWEPDATGSGFALKKAEGPEPSPQPSMDVWLSRALIRFYQTDISPSSISRCPFLVSCSNFAMRAIQKYGFLPGTLLFIDRIYYRENSAAYLFYPKKRDGRLILKLDDTFFLDGEARHEPAR